MTKGSDAVRARGLMVLGTASHVGKSVVAAALGRILSDLGHRVAPFKAQNMSLNSAATPDGCEIGRAQALQAEACRVTPTADMNPVLLKPSAESRSQVVVRGKVWREVSAKDYHQRVVRDLFPVVVESYRRLAAAHDVIVLEGAGSPAEVNLRAGDIVNLHMAKAADASCILLADIDRGGAFASLVGTLALLRPEERRRIRGFAMNKFRGDVSILRPGLRWLERRIRRPCFGVIPFVPDLGLDEEDGVADSERRTPARTWHGLAGSEEGDRPLRIGVIALPHIANFTDFDALADEPSVALAFLERPADIQDADLLVLPGTKQTLDDLTWLRRKGFEPAIKAWRRKRPARGLVGVCGGLQMIGRRIEDPQGVESEGETRTCKGLGLLPLVTVLERQKTTRRVSGRILPGYLLGRSFPETPVHGYEIHMGLTRHIGAGRSLSEIIREGTATVLRDGAVDLRGFTMGTYLHGIFDQDAFRHRFLEAARRSLGLEPPRTLKSREGLRDARIQRFADVVRESLDVQAILTLHTDMPRRAGPMLPRKGPRAR